MLKSKTPGRARRIAGAATVAVLASAGGLAAWAAAPQDQAAEEPPSIVLPSTINLSNAGGELALPGAQDAATRARIQSAMAAGDLRGVVSLGGTAQDVVQMLAARGGPMADMLSSGGEASFVNANGRLGVMVDMATEDGRARRGIAVPPELEGVAPPANATVLPPMGEAGPTGPGEVVVRRTIPAP